MSPTTSVTPAHATRARGRWGQRSRDAHSVCFRELRRYGFRVMDEQCDKCGGEGCIIRPNNAGVENASDAEDGSQEEVKAPRRSARNRGR